MSDLGRPALTRTSVSRTSRAAHLRSAGYRTTGAGIDPACRDLCLLLAVPCIPERLHSLVESLVEVG